MCGILGFFETTSKRNRAELQTLSEKMAFCLAHRGPDDSGTWQDPDVPMVLAHRRLSIIDLTAEGHQPKESHNGRYVISYNGEVYNYLLLQKELEEAGVNFQGRSDTEVLLAAFEEWGVNRTLQKINGMFVFAVWDKKNKQIHFVRDRLGQKPLYVGWAGKTLVFSSELKVFHAYPDFTATINRDVLALYMRYGCVPAPYSIYDRVWHLPPGNRLTLNVTTLSGDEDLSDDFEPYWHLPRVVEEARSKAKITDEAQAVKDFETLLQASVQDRMISDVPLGAFLSGGLDSSLVVALMQSVSTRPVKTFTVGFENAGFDEAAQARKVSEHLGTEHYEQYLTPQDAQDIIALLPNMYDEPFADESQIPTFLISRFAREHVTVALSGDGGDEMLGGYSRHSTLPRLWSQIGWLPPFARKLLASGIRGVSPNVWDKLGRGSPRFGEKLHKVADVLPHRSRDGIYRDLVSRWHDPEHTLVKGARHVPEYLTMPSWHPQGLTFAEQLIYNDALTYLPNDVLAKVDRASMAVSLECRSPFLDHRVLEYVWQLPPAMKIRKGQGKWLLRQVLAKHVPQKLTDRPKQGFSVPLADWLGGPLSEWMEDLLNTDKLEQQGYLDTASVRQSLARFQGGASYEAYRLWTVLMFQSWLERWH